MTNIYALYRGDHFIDVGTKYELAQRLNLKLPTLIFKASPAYYKRTTYEKSLRLYLIKGSDLNEIKGAAKTSSES